MTDVENAEKLRTYYLTHNPRKGTRNVCTGRRNWNVCDYGDIYGGCGEDCWKQDGNHKCDRCIVTNN